ncbi:hypothetical protein F6R98_06395 [Candidatus Methylospira mobilis]|uniref:Uncharacterized protein n=1 Tax=Candidatus Methylospira mobilis TaxID=1808979 RepID=A0A5Q0BEQ3_9GAMM|nr:VPA1262 family N-terminal domain-containing protein [Candidatus Methylospira mobilis]QFY42300.1 hypothetical protein F6R98_06395 [Candidatus Methylospira mobilis]
MDEVAKLMTPGCLGFYDQAEVTEIFACLPDKSIVNVFTIIVTEERNCEELVDPVLVNENRIKLDELKKWSFGIKRYTKRISDITEDISRLMHENIWSACGIPLQLDRLEHQPPRFVAPDSFDAVPINNILKNNFFNGSYIVEWFDNSKLQLACFFDNPLLIQELSEKIQRHIPLSLASVSDRLGNIILQIPVTVLMTRIRRLPQDNYLELAVAWHNNASPRKLRVTCESEFDRIINGFASRELLDGSTLLPMRYDYGSYRYIVWDDCSELILAMASSVSFISCSIFNINIIEPESRIFGVAIGNAEKTERVSLISVVNNKAGKPSSIVDSTTQKRLYQDEKERLKKQRKFVEFKPAPGKQDAQHEEALKHIRVLIGQYGEKGAWLWDPYLDIDDVLKTLFYCPFFHADLRALTSLKTHSDCDKKTNKISQLEQQREALKSLKSNFHGLKLEFRALIGSVGWEFHDRFLIFPETQNGTLAWSLGTSVNSLGKNHHILQQVDDGQLIADSFLEIWNQLCSPEQLIWKRS